MSDYQRLYLILRPAQGSAGGHARLEQRGARGQLSLFVHGLPGRCRLRALIFAQLAPDGAVIDLGGFDVGDKGQGFLERSGLILPGGAALADCHTLAVCQDWPSSRLVMAAPIRKGSPAPRWELQRAIDAYLSVPVQAPPPERAAQSLEKAPEPSTGQPEPQAPSEEALRPAEDTPPQPLPAPLPSLDESEAPMASFSKKETLFSPAPESPPPLDPDERPWVDALAPLYWPREIAELKIYFDLLPPCAPFDAPGWRFVKAPLPKGGPGPVCYIGIRPQGMAVAQTAYALPGSPQAGPPPGLENYTFETGRLSQGYWVLRQGGG